MWCKTALKSRGRLTRSRELGERVPKHRSGSGVTREANHPEWHSPGRGDTRSKINFLSWLNFKRTLDKRRGKMAVVRRRQIKKGHHFPIRWLKKCQIFKKKKNWVTPISCRPRWHQPQWRHWDQASQNALYFKPRSRDILALFSRLNSSSLFTLALPAQNHANLHQRHQWHTWEQRFNSLHCMQWFLVCRQKYKGDE